MHEKLTVEVMINAPIEKIWEYWTSPKHITHWNFASDDWIAPKAENDLSVGGKFKCRMEAKDGSSGFDLEGTYTAIESLKKIEYVMSGDDKREVSVEFFRQGSGYKLIETFDPENINPHEMQINGWQAILNNFKKYVEQN